MYPDFQAVGNVLRNLPGQWECDNYDSSGYFEPRLLQHCARVSAKRESVYCRSNATLHDRAPCLAYSGPSYPHEHLNYGDASPPDLRPDKFPRRRVLERCSGLLLLLIQTIKDIGVGNYAGEESSGARNVVQVMTQLTYTFKP